MTFLQVDVIVMVVAVINCMWAFLFKDIFQYLEGSSHQIFKQFLCLSVFSLIVLGWVGNGKTIWNYLPPYIEQQEESLDAETHV